jgi:metallophosphoesterase superfamily enzyme
MSDTPILVISDTHFGFEDRSQDSFQHFMEYVTSWVHEGTKKIEETDETLDAPQKIIILGDFIDLWVSRDHNRTSISREL